MANIPTPQAAMNFNGITVPGQKPGSLGSDQAINSIFERDQRGGQLPEMIKQLLAMAAQQRQSASIPTPQAALKSGGLTFPGLKPGSPKSDTAENAVFENDMRGGELPQLIKDVLSMRAQQQQSPQRIRVRKIGTEEIGTIPENEFDNTQFERLQ